MEHFNLNNHPALIALLVVLAVWELVWKGLALWRAGHQGQAGWFIAILILNTAGILPIIYLLLNKKTPAGKK